MVRAHLLVAAGAATTLFPFAEVLTSELAGRLMGGG
jgi:hypothetical protein